MVLVRLSVPKLAESAMVWGVSKTPVALASKMIVLGTAGLGKTFSGLLLTLTLAQPTAVRRVPISPESTAVVTR